MPGTGLGAPSRPCSVLFTETSLAGRVMGMVRNPLPPAEARVKGRNVSLVENYVVVVLNIKS